VINVPSQPIKSIKTLIKGLYASELHEEYIRSQPFQSDLLIAESEEASLHYMGAINRLLQSKPTLVPFFNSNHGKWRKAIKNNS